MEIKEPAIGKMGKLENGHDLQGVDADWQLDVTLFTPHVHWQFQLLAQTFGAFAWEK